ncbi:nucleotidyltransferase domain-containing protein [Candidatus Woesearchaeota archaeon]|nr:nucleotidyltransferase domain-containing protein [Candidatus Woesearchaeota archaeon]
MLTPTQLKILAHLTDHPNKHLGIRELARDISTVYYLVQKNIQQLKKEKIINIVRAGKTDLIFLNKQIDSAGLVEAENFKKEHFYQKYPHLKITLRKIIASVGSSFFILLVFGSYAKNRPREDSDLDLLVVVPHQGQVELMERIISSAARTSTFRIHETIVTEKSFVLMLSKKELNVANEAKETHILIYGTENYYKLTS